MRSLIFLLFVVSQSLLAQGTANLDLVFHWNDDNIVGSNWYDNAYNECWGIVVNDREFAVIGSTEGTHIFDITDIDTASEVAFIEGAYTGGGVVHRDYHDYNGYLYIVCDEGPSTMQIVDISNLPESFDVVYDANELILRSHNIFIDTINAVLYSCGGADINGGVQLKTIDISNPAQPVEIKRYFETWGYVHDVYVKDNIAYLNCGGNGLFIVDFDDPINPTVLGSLDVYPGLSYNHSGWLSDDGVTYVMLDETHGVEVYLCDVSNPEDIQILSSVNSGSSLPNAAIAHNAMIRGNYLFVSYYYDGLHVFDLSDSEAPCTAGNYDTSEWEYDFNYRGNWGLYCYLPSGKIIASDMQEGLFVFEVVDEETTDVDCPIMADWYGPEEPIDTTNTSIFNNLLDLQINTQLENNQLHIYNPYTNIQGALYDLNGKLIISITIKPGNSIIDLTALNSGIYILNTINATTSSSCKILIK